MRIISRNSKSLRFLKRHLPETFFAEVYSCCGELRFRLLNWGSYRIRTYRIYGMKERLGAKTLFLGFFFGVIKLPPGMPQTKFLLLLVKGLVDGEKFKRRCVEDLDYSSLTTGLLIPPRSRPLEMRQKLLGRRWRRRYGKKAPKRTDGSGGR